MTNRHHALHSTWPGTVLAESVSKRSSGHNRRKDWKVTGAAPRSSPIDRHAKTRWKGRATIVQTVTALFDSHTTAYSAVQDLVDHGFARDSIGVMARDDTGSYGQVTARVATPDGPSGVAQGAGVGAALGSLGGLVVGITVLAVPGVGPVLAGGLLAAALTGAGVGAVTGGMIGALTELGIPKEHVHYYSEGLRRGGVLVVLATTDTMAELAMTLLSHHHPADLHTRTEEWRQDRSSHMDLHEEV